MKSVAKKRPTNKKSAEKPVSDEIKRAAKRAGINREPPLDETPITLPKYELQWLDRLLERAQDVVLRAPSTFNGGIPPLGGLYGSSAAVSAHSDIRTVRDELAKAMGMSS